MGSGQQEIHVVEGKEGMREGRERGRERRRKEGRKTKGKGKKKNQNAFPEDKISPT